MMKPILGRDIVSCFILCLSISVCFFFLIKMVVRAKIKYMTCYEYFSFNYLCKNLRFYYQAFVETGTFKNVLLKNSNVFI